MKILLHTCCAPCLTYPASWLRESGFVPTSYYYNPNIYPEAEYVKRYFVLKGYAGQEEIPLVFDFDAKAVAAGDCSVCYETRLRKTAKYARNNGFIIFSTTLLISPYQKHDLLKETGVRVGREVGIEFFYQDFREGYRESRDLARQSDLYCQKYCGCEKSRAEQCSARTKIKREKKKSDQAAKITA